MRTNIDIGMSLSARVRWSPLPIRTWAQAGNSAITQSVATPYDNAAEHHYQQHSLQSTRLAD